MRRLVEAELLLELADELRIEPLRAAVARRGRVRAGSLGPRPGAAGEVAGPARDARRRAGVDALQLRDDALDRPAGRELHGDEGQEHDPEQRRDHQQHAAGDIGGHQRNPVIPGPRVARSPEPITTTLGCFARPPSLGLWVPGSRFASPGMTVARVCKALTPSRSLSPSRDRTTTSPA